MQILNNSNTNIHNSGARSNHSNNRSTNMNSTASTQNSDKNSSTHNNSIINNMHADLGNFRVVDVPTVPWIYDENGKHLII